MARSQRLEFEGAFHPVMNRGRNHYNYPSVTSLLFNS